MAWATMGSQSYWLKPIGGALPDWFIRIELARHLGVTPDWFDDKPPIWLDWALIAYNVDVAAKRGPVKVER
jgi:hypothetical protein